MDVMIFICHQASPETANIFAQEFVQDGWTSTKTVMRRQVTLVLRGRSFLYARMLQVHQPVDAFKGLLVWNTIFIPLMFNFQLFMCRVIVMPVFLYSPSNHFRTFMSCKRKSLNVA